MENVCKDNPSSAEFSEDFVEILPVFQLWETITFLFEKIDQKFLKQSCYAACQLSNAKKIIEIE